MTQAARITAMPHPYSNANRALNLAEGGQILLAVVEFGGARVRVVSHVLCGFEQTAVLQENRKSGSPERMMGERLGQARNLCAGCAVRDNRVYHVPRTRGRGRRKSAPY